MGWTGDIAVFSPTALYNFELSRFWRSGCATSRPSSCPQAASPTPCPVPGIRLSPPQCPRWPWTGGGDACVLVPWALYEATGSLDVLRMMYPTMQKYVKACCFWAGFGIGKHRYIWHTPSVLHFGDWVAPDVPKMSQWQARSKYTATASLCNTSGTLAKIARILGKTEDAAKYKELSRKVADAYCSVLTDATARRRKNSRPPMCCRCT